MARDSETGPAGSIDAIPVPEGLSEAEAKAFRDGARAGLDEGYRRGASAGRAEGQMPKGSTHERCANKGRQEAPQGRQSAQAQGADPRGVHGQAGEEEEEAINKHDDKKPAPDYAARDWLSDAAEVNEDMRRRLAAYHARQRVELPCDTEGE